MRINLSLLLAFLSITLPYKTAYGDGTTIVHSIGVYEGTPSEALKVKSQEFRDEYQSMRDVLLRGRSEENISPKERDMLNEFFNEMNGKIEHATNMDTPRVRINVSSSNGGPIALVLSSYNQTEWILDVDPKTKIDKVILFGYYKQKLKSNVQVKVSDYSEYAKTKEYFLAYRDDRSLKYDQKWTGDGSHPPTCTTNLSSTESELSNALKRIKELTGSSPASLQGRYEGDSFKITELTSGNLLPVEYDSGYCYRDTDGTIKRSDEIVRHGKLSRLIVPDPASFLVKAF